MGWRPGSVRMCVAKGKGWGWGSTAQRKGRLFLICTDTVWPAGPCPSGAAGDQLCVTLRLLSYLYEAQPRYLPSAHCRCRHERV